MAERGHLDPRRVAVDVSAAARDRTTGWERFAVGLADATAAVRLAPAGTASGRVGNLARQIAWQGTGLRAAARRSGVDLVHAPAYPPTPLPVPVTWSVFDSLILGRHPQWASKGSRLWVPLGRRAARRVARVVTYTNAVAAELADCGVEPARIVVLPPALTPLPAPTEPPHIVDHTGAPAVVPDEFVLAVGTVQDRKQPDVAAQAAAQAGVPIVFVGRRTGEAADLAAALPGAYFADAADDGQLSWCYRHAAALVAASAYEGIDLPVLEAASVGLPVAASDIAVHRELADTHLFTAGSPDDAAVAVLAAAAAPRTPRRQPTWADSAAAHLQLWADVLDEGTVPCSG